MRWLLPLGLTSICILLSDGAAAQKEVETTQFDANSRRVVVRSDIRFSDVRQPATIPDSGGAAFCALTFVDDDHPAGWCKVFYVQDAKEWRFQTGAGGGQQACAVSCMWIK